MARYQRVTDAMRAQVASEVGDLIWADPQQAQLTLMLTVRRRALAVVIAAAERCLALHGPDAAEAAELAAALADLRSSMSGEPEPPENSKNEPKT